MITDSENIEDTATHTSQEKAFQDEAEQGKTRQKWVQRQQGSVAKANYIKRNKVMRLEGRKASPVKPFRSSECTLAAC